MENIRRSVQMRNWRYLPRYCRYLRGTPHTRDPGLSPLQHVRSTKRAGHDHGVVVFDTTNISI
ncbi:hypothetical protein ACRALDRAFT_209925 [Sodiomyces alcalophilus JCM 7366]|uniref:uncharacterized protein n=1 Tax=Sodiomyces alcalophilus JCM 7366 TaxID=591952 RepID=UPI0039B53C3B